MLSFILHLKSLLNRLSYFLFGASLLPQMIKNLLTMPEAQVQSSGLGRFPGDGNGNPLQYSCLENLMDRGAWQDAVHRVTKELGMTKHTCTKCNKATFYLKFLFGGF